MIEPLDYESMRDDDLARIARAGDRLARNALYLRHAQLISRRIIPATRCARNLAAAGAPIDEHDVEQQAFIHFCDLVAEWDPHRAPFLPFLSAMIPRRAWSYVRQFQHLRQHRVRIVPVSYLRSLPPASMLSLDPDEDDPPSALRSSHFPGSGEQALITALDCQDLVSTLRADWKRFLLLRFWEDKSSRHIAAQASCSSRTVERGVSAALSQLRRHLDEDKAAV